MQPFPLQNVLKSGTDDLILTIVPNSGEMFGKDGKTDPPDNDGVITIKLNEYNCNGQEHPLEVAGTILHEGIHAEMYRRALREKGGPLDIESYEEIWDINLEIKYPFFEKPYSLAQHEIMAKAYVDDIAGSLQELDNYCYSDLDYYKYIAWTGLQEYGHILGLVSQNLDEYHGKYNTLISTDRTGCN